MSVKSGDLLEGLKDFQRASVEHAFERLYLDPAGSRRFLIADETGLGKTMVAKGLIAKTIEHLQHDDSVHRIDIIYVCSNTDIADQNLRKLVIAEDHKAAPATRLSMLVAQPELLASATKGPKPVTLVAFTPGTSFNMGDQSGMARERAVLYRLLAPTLGVHGATATALKRILQGGVSTLAKFQSHIDQQKGKWEPSIRRHFLSDFKRSKARTRLQEFIDEVRGKPSLSKEQSQRATALTAQLRRLLAKAGVQALEPDLVILDEFQRFKNLLDRDDPAAELAHHLFDQPDARVLLLSATPYKPFTLAEESAAGEDHYSDLFRTLDFLARGDGTVDGIRTNLAFFRDAALAGRPLVELRDGLRTSLLRLMSRVERRTSGKDVTHTHAGPVSPADIAGFVALHRLATAIDAPLTIEYWKAAPYFANFLDGYRVGQQMKAALGNIERRHDLQPLLRATQRIHRRDVDQFRPIDWGNARLRRLADDTVERGWWRLLWMPPSMAYHEPGGVYSGPGVEGITKRIVFSSWVAAPSAIASLLSYEAERRIRSDAGRLDRDRFTPRLQYRLKEGRPSAMTTLALFWPSPTLAAITDPLDAAKATPTQKPSDGNLEAWGAARIRAHFGDDGEGIGTASTSWYWSAAIGADASTPLGEILTTVGLEELTDSLLGQPDESEGLDTDTSRSLLAHLDEARNALANIPTEGPRPADLVTTLLALGLSAPGNVAWRALRRLATDTGSVTPLGLWKAAAVLASGFRSLFNRPDATYLLDSLGADNDDDNYWRSVLRYCRDGNIQAVLDEYVHHLAGAEGIDISSDDGLMRLAAIARRALAVRGASYQAADLDHPDAGPIRFFGRFALRYGGIKQQQDDVRLPEVRAAFNSPFWPFVLATTSIGQEGVDFHWWCHSIVHWNLPANPVDFEQREGRVNRFHGHAIRKNVAACHRNDALTSGVQDIWTALFDAAEGARDPGVGDMTPHWQYPGDAQTERYVLGFPLSRDSAAWTRLRDVIALYRLAYGQPRQDVMVELLQRRGFSASQVEELALNLHPPV